MLHDDLGEYLSRIEAAVRNCRSVYVERYVEEILTPKRVNLRIRIRFQPGQLLEINEALVIENNQLVPLDYRYHCQDVRNRLIFRYDNTPHFPELSGFPAHKHLPDAVVPSPKPEIEQVLREAVAHSS